MGRGSSGARGGGGGTPSGVTEQQFRAMTDQEKIDTINRILTDPNIQVPDYLDSSDTSKVMYALGMANKPTVVSDAALDSMPGRDIYRTVYDAPGVSSQAIMDQIRYGDFTQMSGSGGSAHGRALYFATDFYESALYGTGEKNPIITRGKLNPNANMISETRLSTMMLNDTTYGTSGSAIKARSRNDRKALYAIAHGLDGWYDSGTGYNMVINRGAITMSDTNKHIYSSSRSGRRTTGHSWNATAVASVAGGPQF